MATAPSIPLIGAFSPCPGKPSSRDRCYQPDRGARLGPLGGVPGAQGTELALARVTFLAVGALRICTLRSTPAVTYFFDLTFFLAGFFGAYFFLAALSQDWRFFLDLSFLQSFNAAASFCA
jgi:hypothetical protein